MAEINASRTLAEALGAAEPKAPLPDAPVPAKGAHDPLVDRLATALTLVPQVDLADFDDADDDLDLPILVQPSRPPVVADPPPPASPRWREGRAALIGFGVGLVLLVPIGVTLTTRLPDQLVVTASTAPQAAPTFQPAAAVVADDSGIHTARRPTQSVAVPAAMTYDEPVAPRAAPAVPVVVPAPLPPAPDHLAIVSDLIGRGEIAGAREALTPEDLDTNPLAVFALAETFDPNMLAAWSARGVHADVERARHLYRRALDHGVMKARQRLDALE